MNIQTQHLLQRMETLNQKVNDLRATALEAHECAQELKNYVDAQLRPLPNIQQIITHIAYYTGRVNKKLNGEEA